MNDRSNARAITIVQEVIRIEKRLPVEERALQQISRKPREYAKSYIMRWIAQANFLRLIAAAILAFEPRFLSGASYLFESVYFLIKAFASGGASCSFLTIFSPLTPPVIGTGATSGDRELGNARMRCQRPI
jgi:hypothetical protein